MTANDNIMGVKPENWFTSLKLLPPPDKPMLWDTQIFLFSAVSWFGIVSFPHHGF